ncbi:membrane protein insertase YidC [Alkalimonas mucilaginosa]|uniref:Membrane protein insertase YidC n=1 Tax=Alkalimonas mucilaginosa TaxID=3057676 RepID=A0ABU7JFG5_9GAMM|nr:membrane protein insertase YidC [Alkalimonas sp. MEB004]MEE2024439.1 membrane protein insertase YidC [Alkalimonas sp. MEB004]
MDSQRSILIIALAFVSFLLWKQWHQDYGPEPVTQQPQAEQLDHSGDLQLSADAFGPQPTATTPVTSQATAQSEQVVRVETDVLQVEISTRGGDIIGLKLSEYELTKDSQTPYVMMRRQTGFDFIAESGLIGRHGPDDKNNTDERPLYQVSQSNFKLTADQQELIVPLQYQHQGLQIEKRFIFRPGQYDVGVEYHISNQSDEVRVVQNYQHLLQTIDGGKDSSFFMPIYRGGAYGTDADRYKKYKFKDMQKRNLSIPTQGGWAAMLEHYFVTAWIPDQQADNKLYSLIDRGRGVIGVLGPVMQLQPGEQTVIATTFYAGPKIQDNLAELANGLDLTVDYGFLFFISQPLFWLLTLIQGFVGNWGLAIILITIIVKGVMYPLTKIQYESMAKMRNLKPKIEDLQARYKDDRQKLGPAMMELYRKEKVNPMGGCLPLLLQMPIFLALYWVFVESVELRHAPFMLWLQDLSAPDPWFVLPVLFGASMFMMQKLTPMTVTDPMQRKLMMWMPVAFSVFFIWFPSGLVLYWLVSNLISLAQMLYIYRGMEKKGLHSRKA